MKIIIVFGTRPELIKLAPVIRELRLHPKDFQLFLLATAQHRQILDQMLGMFELVPDRDLDLMLPNQSLDTISIHVLQKVTEVLTAETPDLVIVQGDTTTAMASTLAAFYKKIPVAHVEAGLRSGDRNSPFPEEINRRVISVLATHHFAPTPKAAANLAGEGIDSNSIVQTGNTVVDALFFIRQKIHGRRKTVSTGKGSRIVLVTAHRRENFGQPLQNICCSLLDLTAAHPDIEIVFPVHPNPNVEQTVLPILSGHERIHLLPPQDYLDLLCIMNDAYLILTDSGGIQEEAPSFQKPVLVLRRNTERPEGIHAGVALLVGTERERIVAEASRLLNDQDAYQRMIGRENPYGDGKASQRIVDYLLSLK